VKPPRLVQPSCSIPIERRFVHGLPACQATSLRSTIWTIRPSRETTKWEEPPERRLRSQRTEPQKLPSVTCTTTWSIERAERQAFVRFLVLRTPIVCRAASASLGETPATATQEATANASATRESLVCCKVWGVGPL
jgi:hypothetical protein